MDRLTSNQIFRLASRILERYKIALLNAGSDCPLDRQEVLLEIREQVELADRILYEYANDVYYNEIDTDIEGLTTDQYNFIMFRQKLATYLVFQDRPEAVSIQTKRMNIEAASNPNAGSIKFATAIKPVDFMSNLTKSVLGFGQMLGIDLSPRLQMTITTNSLLTQ